MQIEIRSNNEAVISGYVNAVERDSRIMPKGKGATAVRSFVERVRAGTFDKAIKRGTPIELRFNHDKIIGDTTSNLELYEDNIGLYARAIISDTEVIEKAQRGELRGWSFGFIAEGETWDKEGELDRRTLEDIDLKEVSILDKTPAYFGTSVEVRGEESNVFETRGIAGNIKLIGKESPKANSLEIYEKELEILKER
ncbi:HK97 family phage prohead protease [Pseudoruminococcus massiliensis]|uniref:HK97 family phage prohead protease n=1 Tax=Pseudoruminococcus massiliensis TaxID=2086583 RepID=UPI00131A57EB|nr:HK97 family phage prohead protease [Pseudoruminococcus massiliensis]